MTNSLNYPFSGLEIVSLLPTLQLLIFPDWDMWPFVYTVLTFLRECLCPYIANDILPFGAANCATCYVKFAQL